MGDKTASCTFCRLDLCNHERRRQRGYGNCEASDAPVWCHATVSQLTSRLATVAATCQHSNEHMVKVLVGEGDGSKTRESDNTSFLSAKGEKKPLTYVYSQDRNNPLLLLEKR